MEYLASLYHRVCAAMLAFQHPGVEVVDGTWTVCVWVYMHGRPYGVYVPVDAPSMASGSGVDVLLVDESGATVRLDPPPLPGLRLRLTPASLGARGALCMDPLEDTVDAYDADSVLP